ncbi:MAG TPA: pentapeptide repeat-containing protein, partial [Anaerolineae bacterium]|nr:pentapeptide repeat-containing protein [Anaerolineae bacterium]
RGANLEGADLSGTHLFEADLTWTKTDVRTAMPQGWEDVVAHGPETRGTAASVVREKLSEQEWLRTEKDAPERQLIT